MVQIRLEKEKEEVTKQLEEEKGNQSKIKTQNDMERVQM